MDDAASGFRIDQAFHEWGTRFKEIVPGDAGRGYAHAEILCRTAYGFTTLHAELTASGGDRPVTSVAYELADTGAPARYLFAQLVIRLGQPREIDRSEVPPGADPSGAVVLYANWVRDKVSVGLSLYGAPRPSASGDSGLGKLYLSWNDMQAAAAPYLAEWNAANQAVAEAAVGAKPSVFSLQYPIFDPDIAPDAAEDLALSRPELLKTPAAIAARLTHTTFALWSDPTGRRWHLSTARTTIVLGGPHTSLIQLQEIAPAKGGGFTGLEVGPWWVRDAYRSASIADAVRMLEHVPSLEIERHTGHDV